MYVQKEATKGKDFRPYLYYMQGSDVFSEAKVMQQAEANHVLLSLKAENKTTLKKIFSSMQAP
jgi:hypothetical protein